MDRKITPAPIHSNDCTTAAITVSTHTLLRSPRTGLTNSYD